MRSAAADVSPSEFRGSGFRRMTDSHCPWRPWHPWLFSSSSSDADVNQRNRECHTDATEGIAASSGSERTPNGRGPGANRQVVPVEPKRRIAVLLGPDRSAGRGIEHSNETGRDRVGRKIGRVVRREIVMASSSGIRRRDAVVLAGAVRCRKWWRCPG